MQSIVTSAPLSLAGNPNTSVTSRQKNLNHDSRVGKFLPIPHQCGNDAVTMNGAVLLQNGYNNTL